MNITIFDGNGKIMSWGSVQAECLNVEVKPGMHYVEGEYPSWDYYADMANGVMVKKPAKPSDGHVWSDTLHEWVADFDKLVEAATERINKGMDDLIVSPIVYDGKLLDADVRSQKNVNDKILELTARESIGELAPSDKCFWKDANNELHFWPDHATYRAWLDKFAIAMSSRGTDAYVWAWAQKKARDKAAADLDVDALLALPVMPETPTV